jgi:hypothetical protein
MLLEAIAPAPHAAPHAVEIALEAAEAAEDEYPNPLMTEARALARLDYLWEHGWALLPRRTVWMMRLFMVSTIAFVAVTAKHLVFNDHEVVPALVLVVALVTGIAVGLGIDRDGR